MLRSLLHNLERWLLHCTRHCLCNCMHYIRGGQCTYAVLPHPTWIAISTSVFTNQSNSNKHASCRPVEGCTAPLCSSFGIVNGSTPLSGQTAILDLTRFRFLSAPLRVCRCGRRSLGRANNVECKQSVECTNNVFLLLSVRMETIRVFAMFAECPDMYIECPADTS
jgi:hypothetical protein